MYAYTCIYMGMDMHIYTYIHIYIRTEKEENDIQRARVAAPTGGYCRTLDHNTIRP